jgi:hypothetical protein
MSRSLPTVSLGLEITVRRSGIFEGVGAIDEDIQSSVFDPLQDLQGAPAPLIHRLGRSRTPVADEMHAEALLPQIEQAARSRADLVTVLAPGERVPRGCNGSSTAGCF